VAGAAPPPDTGHGWPALPCAGSAASGDGRSPDAVPVRPQGAAHPAERSFFGSREERNTAEINSLGDIHYAHF
jgi:hypothetical protein